MLLYMYNKTPTSTIATTARMATTNMVRLTHNKSINRSTKEKYINNTNTFYY